jgi:hypothetical protein
MTNLPPVIFLRILDCGRAVDQVQAAALEYSEAVRRRVTLERCSGWPAVVTEALSDHVEEIEQDDDGDRNAENPEQYAAHDKPRFLEAIERSWAAINGSSMADRITDQCL